MPTVHVSEGERTYMPDTQTYGEVTKTSVLGTDAVVVECDDGSMKVFCGNDILDKVVNSSGQNGNGEDVELPTDVKEVGTAVLESLGLDESTRAALFQKFMVLDADVRLEKAAYWETYQNDTEVMAVFLPELMELLDEDTLYIQTQAAQLLSHLDDDTREVMLTSFMEKTTSDERRDMIISYTSVRNDHFKTEEFLQELYELLLDNETYLMMEFTKALGLAAIYEPESTTLITTFLTNSSEEEQQECVDFWRTHKLYSSKKGKTYAEIIVTKFADSV